MIGGKRHDRVPFDWYVEPRWTVEALFDAYLMLGSVGDPACGLGTIPEVAVAHGHFVAAADIVDRGYPRMTAVEDFLADAAASMQGIDNLIFNPPYSYRPNIAEHFVRKALRLAQQTVATIVPVSWLTGEVRFSLFSEHPPAHILYFLERPSMPPGAKIRELGRRAFRGGRIPYCWVIWERLPRGEFHGVTQSRWIAPRVEAVRRSAMQGGLVAAADLSPCESQAVAVSCAGDVGAVR